MRAERSIRQITDAAIIIYGPPIELFSASENSSQVSYRETLVLRTTERVTWGFNFMLHEHRLAFLV